MTLEDPSAASGPETSPSLDPVLQDRAKALVSQLHKAYLRDQLSPPVTTAIGELSQALIDTGDLTPSPPPPSSRQVRLEQLVNQVHTVLRQQSLDAAVQIELSKLLSLLSNLETASIPLDEFELAITALVQSPSGQASPNNLRFARSLRHRIAVKLKQDANPLKAIINASGSPHNRLISGLSWFFLIFTVVPSTLALAVFLSGVTQQNNLLERQNEQLIALQKERQQLTTRVASLDEAVDGTGELLRSISIDALITQASSDDNQPSAPLDRQSQRLNNLNNLINDLNNRLDDPADETDQNIQEELAAIRSIQEELAAIRTLSREVRSTARTQRTAIIEAIEVISNAPNLAVSESGSSSGEENNNGGENNTSVSEPQSPAEVDWLTVVIRNMVSINFPLILAVVVMGAMGSFVSVIVRANEFIEADKSQDQDQDLFLIGFFRPIVGMTFALFLLALLESGVFLSDSIRGDRERRIYLYTAIAFAAGFSERLVKDLITEHTERFVRK